MSSWSSRNCLCDLAVATGVPSRDAIPRIHPFLLTRQKNLHEQLIALVVSFLPITCPYLSQLSTILKVSRWTLVPLLGAIISCLKLLADYVKTLKYDRSNNICRLVPFCNRFTAKWITTINYGNVDLQFWEFNLYFKVSQQLLLFLWLGKLGDTIVEKKNNELYQFFEFG